MSCTPGAGQAAPGATPRLEARAARRVDRHFDLSRDGACRAAALVLGGLLLLLGGAACAARSPGFVFAAPQLPESRPRPHALWLERVSFEEPSTRERELTEVAFTYNLARYLRGRRLFSQVRVPPGPVAADDWVASLRVERWVERAHLPPSAYLLSALTLGFYLYAGAPAELEVDVDAQLDVRDGRGRPVGSSSFRDRSAQSATVRAATTQLSFFLDERARVIDALFEEVLEQRAGPAS